MYDSWITPNRCMQDPDRPIHACALCGAQPQGGATTVICLDGRGYYVCSACYRKNRTRHQPVAGWLATLPGATGE